MRGYHKMGETAAVMPGAKLADIVTKHMCMVFTEHRKALKNNLGYSIRDLGSVRVDALQRRATALTIAPCESDCTDC